jgi:hypothetical protein
MALIAVCAGKGSPGATVASLSFTLSWRRRIILAECDPAGGDIAAGYLRETALGGRSIGQLTASMGRGRLTEDFWSQLVDLTPGPGRGLNRLALPGLVGTGQAAGLSDVWHPLAQLFLDLEHAGRGYDVIADCGRLVTAYPPVQVLSAAHLVLLAVRPTFSSIRSAATCLRLLADLGVPQTRLVVIGDGAYSPRDVSLGLRVGLAAHLPHDSGTAAVLAGGGERHRGRLLRAAAQAEAGIWQLVDAARRPPSGQQRPEVSDAH